MIDRDKIARAGFDPGMEERIDEHLAAAQVDFNTILYYQVNRCFLALSIGELFIVKNTVDAFGVALAPFKDNEYEERIKYALKVMENEIEKQADYFADAHGYSPDEFEMQEIKQVTQIRFYREKMEALVELCIRKQIFGKKQIENEI